MASNQTPSYGLNQWSLNDYVIMEEFNEDNRKTEQALLALKSAMPRIATGSYVGTGTSGEDNPNTLEFDFTPQLIIVTTDGASNYITNTSDNSAPWIFVRPWQYTNRFSRSNTSSTSYYTYVTWLEKGVSWYVAMGNGNPHPIGQLNAEGQTYHYLAIG